MGPFWQGRPKFERLAFRIVGGRDTLRIFDILSRYSHKQIALAYAYWAIGEEGIGYTRPKPKKG